MAIPLPPNRILRAALLGCIISLPFGIWASLVYAANHDHVVAINGLTLPQVWAGYLVGGLAGGVAVGLALPLYRSILGAYLLGVLALLPLYLAVSWLQDPAEPWLSRIGFASLVSSIVGGPLAVGNWLKDHDRDQAPAWVNTLRYPTWATVGQLWVLAISLAGFAWWIGTRWPGGWQAGVAIAVFLVPLAMAVGVTLVALRRR